MELYSTIQELLASNDFVSLPGVGSFVQKYEPARLSPDGDSFLPPRQSVSFDTSRTFNDGLLERYLQDKHGLTSLDAAKRVQDFVDEVKTSIDSSASVSFEGVGTLRKSFTEGLAFTPADELHRASEAFGLKPVKVSELKAPLSSTTEQPKLVASTPPHPQKVSQFSSVGIPIMLATAAMAVLMLLGGLMIFVPELRFWRDQNITLDDHNSNSYALAELEELTNSVQTAEQDSASDVTGLLEAESIMVEEKVDVITDKKRALFYEEPDDKTYYIIAGSFEQVENAQVLLNSLAKQGYNPEILQSDGRFRVSISKFSERNRALRELARLRAQKSTESVWLLGL